MDANTWKKVKETLQLLPLALRIHYLQELKKHTKDKHILKEIDTTLTNLKKQELDMKEWKRIGTPTTQTAPIPVEEKREPVNPERLRETVSPLEHTVAPTPSSREQSQRALTPHGDPTQYTKKGDFDYTQRFDYTKLETFEYGFKEDPRRTLTGSQGPLTDYTPEFKREQQAMEGRPTSTGLLKGGLEEFTRPPDYTPHKKKKES